MDRENFCKECCGLHAEPERLKNCLKKPCDILKYHIAELKKARVKVANRILKYGADSCTSIEDYGDCMESECHDIVDQNKVDEV